MISTFCAILLELTEEKVVNFMEAHDEALTVDCDKTFR